MISQLEAAILIFLGRLWLRESEFLERSLCVEGGHASHRLAGWKAQHRARPAPAPGPTPTRGPSRPRKRAEAGARGQPQPARRSPRRRPGEGGHVRPSRGRPTCSPACAPQPLPRRPRAPAAASSGRSRRLQAGEGGGARGPASTSAARPGPARCTTRASLSQFRRRSVPTGAARAGLLSFSRAKQMRTTVTLKQ